MEQGVDALIEFQLLVDPVADAEWAFTGWDVIATVSDAKGRQVFPVTVDVRPSGGLVRLILPEGTVNGLRVGRPYRYDCLMAAPGDIAAYDHHLAAGPASVSLRTSRRDP
jgi:hypothetical protein